MPKLNGGGTNFEAAFEEASIIIEVTPSNYIPVIIFLTDGHGGGSYENILKKIY